MFPSRFPSCFPSSSYFVFVLETVRSCRCSACVRAYVRAGMGRRGGGSRGSGWVLQDYKNDNESAHDNIIDDGK